MRRKVLAALALVAVMGACAPKDGDDNVLIAANADSGAVEVGLPGFKAKVDLPPGLLKGGKVDLGGVELYPGSTVKTVNVDTRTPETPVVIGFTAPGSVDAVRQYFVDAFKAKSMTVAPNANGVAGTASDGDSFTIALTPEGAGTAGQITITEKK